MPRGASRRTWVKFFITGWLHGSIRWQLEPDERSVWADLICMAGECSLGGKIADNDGNPFPRSFIATHLNISPELLDRTVAKCRKEGRLVDEDNILIISNWTSYQSEYERQKPYREPAKAAADVPDDKPFWAAYTARLESAMSKANYRTWINVCTGYHQGTEVFIICPTTHVADYLEKNQRSLLERTASEVLNTEIKELHIQVK